MLFFFFNFLNSLDLFFLFVKVIFQSSNPLIVVFCFPSNLFFYFNFHPCSFNYIVFRFFCVANFFHLLIVVFCFPSNLFFYFNFQPCSFNYIVFRFFCVANFFHGFISLTLDLLGIELRNFFIYSASRLMTRAMCLKS